MLVGLPPFLQLVPRLVVLVAQGIHEGVVHFGPLLKCLAGSHICPRVRLLELCELLFGEHATLGGRLLAILLRERILFCPRARLRVGIHQERLRIFADLLALRTVSPPQSQHGTENYPCGAGPGKLTRPVEIVGAGCTPYGLERCSRRSNSIHRWSWHDLVVLNRDLAGTNLVHKLQDAQKR